MDVAGNNSNMTEIHEKLDTIVCQSCCRNLKKFAVALTAIKDIKERLINLFPVAVKDVDLVSDEWPVQYVG